MADQQQVKLEFGRGRFVVMGIAVLTSMASFVLLCIAFFQLHAGNISSGHAGMLAIIACILFAAAVLCFISLILRYISATALSVSTLHEPTEYINAWQVAADRMNLEDGLPHEPGADDILIDTGDDDDEYEEDPDDDSQSWR